MQSGGPRFSATSPPAGAESAPWRALVFPAVILALVALANWILVATFGGTRDLGSAAAAVIVVPGANLIAGGVALALLPVARWTLRPRSLKAHVATAIVGPLLAVVVDIAYIRSLPLGH